MRNDVKRHGEIVRKSLYAHPGSCPCRGGGRGSGPRVSPERAAPGVARGDRWHGRHRRCGRPRDSRRRRGDRRHRHRGRRYGGEHREAVPRPRDDRRHRADHPSRSDQHPHARRHGAVPGAGRRPRAHRVVEQVHLSGRSEDRLAGVRARRNATRRAGDDSVRHDDLRGHVLLRGGGRRRDEGGRPPRRAWPDDHSVSRSPTPRRPPTASSAPRRSSRRSRTTRSSRPPSRRMRCTRSTARR